MRPEPHPTAWAEYVKLARPAIAPGEWDASVYGAQIAEVERLRLGWPPLPLPRRTERIANQWRITT